MAEKTAAVPETVYRSIADIAPVAMALAEAGIGLRRVHAALNAGEGMELLQRVQL